MSPTQQHYRDLLMKVYLRINPEKLVDLNVLVNKYKEELQDLYLWVCKKYGVSPETLGGSVGQGGGSGTDSFQRDVSPPPPSPANGHEQLPSGWSSHVDKISGETFYYNKVSGVRQWTSPQMSTDLELGEKPQKASRDDLWAVVQQPQIARSTWKEIRTPDGKLFYRHSSTGQSQWNVPKESKIVTRRLMN